MMKRIVCSIFIFFGMSFSLWANDAPRLTVVELFTSQGCSSCPPADAVLKTMRDKPGLLTLSWPVDYWDRLGWEDTFAMPYNAKRQAAYNKRFGRGGVFTPQMVFDGRQYGVGSDKADVRSKIASVRAIDRIDIKPEISFTSDGSASISLPETDLSGMMITVRIVWYQSNATVEIGDGENVGRQLHYTNVVRAFDMLDDWMGEARSETFSMDGINPDATHVAVLLQEGYGHGPVFGAASAALSH